MLKTIITTALLATTVAAAAPAIAQDEPVARQVSVSYADLDLRRAADVKRLDHRLLVAVGRVCSDTDGLFHATELDKLHCRHDALARLQGQRNAAIASVQATKLALNTPAR